MDHTDESPMAAFLAIEFEAVALQDSNDLPDFPDDRHKC